MIKVSYLIVLFVTVTILSILLATGIPSFHRQLESNRARTATDALIQAMQLTRTKAISNNRRATLRKLGDQQSGWEVFLDRDFDGVRDAIEAQKIATAGPFPESRSVHMARLQITCPLSVPARAGTLAH